MNLQHRVNIILCFLGIVQIVLLAIACDSIMTLEKFANVDSLNHLNAHFSEIKADSVVTESVIINPVVIEPCE